MTEVIRYLIAGIGLGMVIMGIWAWCCIGKFERREK